jgi:hypothetical protein
MQFTYLTYIFIFKHKQKEFTKIEGRCEYWENLREHKFINHLL